MDVKQWIKPVPRTGQGPGRLFVFFFVFFLFPLTAFTPGNPRVIHVYVALCDNKNQGIVPVLARLGKGDDPANNLYWGAAYGIKTFFSRQPEWRMVQSVKNPAVAIAERCIFRNKAQNAWLVADAYYGIEIKKCIVDFLESCSGKNENKITMDSLSVTGGGAADLVAYIGHDGLMDFTLEEYPAQANKKSREAIVLACISKQYFREGLQKSGVYPLLWTTGLMAPEAYTLHAALNSWLAGESRDSVRSKAAQAYSKYQKCSLRAAKHLLVTGW
jgi:hypothetical protein